MSLLKQHHDQEISYEPIYRVATSGMSCASNCRSLKKPWLSSNNDPLQDYIRRTLAGKAMCRSSERVPIVYSTLSNERGNEIIRKPVQKYMDSEEKNPRRYFITSAPSRSNPTGYHPYFEQTRGKHLLINRNGVKASAKSLTEPPQFKNKQELPYKISSAIDRLDFIDRYISQNTDQFGYVALNETILNELGTAISECLSRKITVSKVICEPLYEPISPAGCSEDED